MKTERNKEMLWVLKFDQFQQVKMIKPSEEPILEGLLRPIKKESSESINRAVKRIEEECLAQFDQGDEEYRQKLEIIEQNIKNIRKIIQIYTHLINELDLPPEEEL